MACKVILKILLNIFVEVLFDSNEEVMDNDNFCVIGDVDGELYNVIMSLEICSKILICFCINNVKLSLYLE